MGSRGSQTLRWGIYWCRHYHCLYKMSFLKTPSHPCIVCLGYRNVGGWNIFMNTCLYNTTLWCRSVSHAMSLSIPCQTFAVSCGSRLCGAMIKQSRGLLCANSLIWRMCMRFWYTVFEVQRVYSCEFAFTVSSTFWGTWISSQALIQGGCTACVWLSLGFARCSL